MRSKAERADLGDDSGAGFGPYAFTLDVIDRLKGSTPDTFEMHAFLTDETDATARHARLVPFWSVLDSGSRSCRPDARLALDTDYLLFLDSNGQYRDFFGYGDEPIRHRDDEWLEAVRRLVAAPDAPMRTADVVTFLRSFDAVMQVTITDCEPPRYPFEDKGYAVEALFGEKPTWTFWLTAFSRPDSCEVGASRIFLLPSRKFGPDDILAFGTEVVDGTVDLEPLLIGKTQGDRLPYGDGTLKNGEFLAPQFELTGRLQWTVEALRAALNDYGPAEIRP